MNFKTQVTTLVEAALEKMPHLFLIELKISADKTIKVVLDGDPEVCLEDCMQFSRAVEHEIDREMHDFALEVSSAGVGSPLMQKRQFIKNIGRELEVVLPGEKPLKGTLVEATEEQIALQWKQREPKPVGKGKITVIKKKTLAYDAIDRARVVI
jgi:ribosome maturation factor RimP